MKMVALSLGHHTERFLRKKSTGNRPQLVISVARKEALWFITFLSGNPISLGLGGHPEGTQRVPEAACTQVGDPSPIDIVTSL